MNGLFQKNRLANILALGISVALTIFGFRLWAIFNYAVGLPLNDQWDSEWHTPYAPYLDKTLVPMDFMQRNDIHVIALQKCLHLLMFIASGEWNPALEMVVNSTLFSLLCGSVAAFVALRIANVWSVVAFTVTLVLLGCSPTARESYLVGFQTGWYVYYILSLCTCWLLFRDDDRPWLFGLGMACALLSAFCLSSGLLNIMMAGLPLGQDIVAFIKRTRRPQWSFWVKLLFALAAGLIYQWLVAPDRRQFSSMSHIWKAFVQGTSWPLPWGFSPLVQAPVAVMVLMEIWRLKTGSVQRIGFHIYLLAWSAMHICATAACRGGWSSRHMELLYFSILSTLFGVMVIKQHCPNRSLNRLFGCWFWCVLAGILFQYGNGLRQLEEWKIFWLKPYEAVYGSLLDGNYDEIRGKTFLRDGVISDWLCSHPETLGSPELGEVLTGLPIKKLWVDPGIDTGLNLAVRTNSSAPHAFVLWQRIDSSTHKSFTMRSSRFPYIKLNIYGRFDSVIIGNDSTHWPLTRSLKMAFGQPTGWRTVFLKSPAPESLVHITIETKPDTWVILQTPVACSQFQYRFEQAGRYAVFVFLFGVWSLAFALTVLVMAKCEQFDLKLP